MSPQKHKNILVCQGGFHVAAGALVGILKRFQDEGVLIDKLVVTSGSAPVGFLSRFKSPREIEAMLTPGLLLSIFTDFNIPGMLFLQSPLKLNALRRFLAKHVPKDITFEQLEGFYVTATLGDAAVRLEQGGKPVIKKPIEGLAALFGRGFTEDISPITAVTYSCSFPSLFKPLEINNTKVTLVEGVKRTQTKVEAIREILKELKITKDLLETVLESNSITNPQTLDKINRLITRIRDYTADPDKVLKDYFDYPHDVLNDLRKIHDNNLVKLVKAVEAEKPVTIELDHALVILRQLKDDIWRVIQTVTAITIQEAEIVNCIAEDGGIRNQYPITVALVKDTISGMDPDCRDCHIPIFEDPKTTTVYTMLLEKELHFQEEHGPLSTWEKIRAWSKEKMRRLQTRNAFARGMQATNTLVRDQLPSEETIAHLLGFNVVPIAVVYNNTDHRRFWNIQPLVEAGYQAAGAALLRP